MRASPAVQVSVRHFGAWRAAVAATAGLGLCVIAAWLTASPRPLAFERVATALAALALLAWSGASLLQVRPASLRWDGRGWFLAALDRNAPDPIGGELQVMIDLGPWMLLRFVPVGDAAVWLPAQRRGAEHRWHALRCAVHSAAAPR